MKSFTEFTTLGDLLIKSADKFGSNPVIVFPEQRISYEELKQRSYRRAQALVAHDIGPGSHVGILMANCMEYIEYLFAAQLVGAMAVPINARYKAPELAYVLDNADIDLLVTHDAISEYANFGQLIDDALIEKTPQRLKHLVMLGTKRKGFISDEAFLIKGKTVDTKIVDEMRSQVSLRNPAIMMYTSGTTANPKGCPLNHEVLVRNGVNMNESRYFLDESDRFWAPLPMFHMASILPLICCMDAGAALLSMLHLEPELSLKMMEKERETIWDALQCLSPSLYII